MNCGKTRSTVVTTPSAASQRDTVPIVEVQREREHLRAASPLDPSRHVRRLDVAPAPPPFHAVHPPTVPAQEQDAWPVDSLDEAERVYAANLGAAEEHGELRVGDQ